MIAGVSGVMVMGITQIYTHGLRLSRYEFELRIGR